MIQRSIVALLRSAAEAEGDKLAFGFLSEQGECLAALSFGRLDLRARSVAAKLQSRLNPGDRALVVCDSGLNWIPAFFGCLYAGVIAVPVPPLPRKRTSDRLDLIARDADAAAILAEPEAQVAVLRSGHKKLDEINISEAGEDVADAWKPPEITRTSPAFLQYTSGSVGNPKGVLINHGNLLFNASHIHDAFQLRSEDRSLSWLPPYHDMGLIGGVVQSVYSRYSTELLSPAAFMNRPLLWLELISQNHVTVSGGPDFAYDLCARIARERGCPKIDLTCWRVAFNGSETVRFETLRSFSAAFSPSGFQTSAFKPCYGLAEATLLVTVSPMPYIVSLDRKGLQRGKVRIVSEKNDKTLSLVSSGVPRGEQSVVIVDPATAKTCAENEIGEIWTHSPGTAQGYWQRRRETRDTFCAKLPRSSRAYLRTGDLGFLHDGWLFVTGRMKELIIIHGRNYYPQDIEATAGLDHPLLRGGCVAAFSIEKDGEERLVIVQEVSRHARQANFDNVIRLIRQEIMDQHEITPDAIVLIRPGALPKTPSGKIRRRACCAQYLEGALPIVAENRIAKSTPSAMTTGADMKEKGLDELLAKHLGCNTEELDGLTSIHALGLDSLRALRLKMDIESVTGAEIPISRLLGAATVADIREWVGSCDIRGNTLPPTGKAPDEFPLSIGQQALWFMQKVEPDSAFLNLSRILRITGSLDSARLRLAFDILVARHPMLRTRIRMRDGQPYQTIVPDGTAFFVQHDARHWTKEQWEKHARDHARRPFDLTREPALRLHLYTRSDRESILLVSGHHIALDLWSFSLMLEELAEVYPALQEDRFVSLERQTSDYSEFVSWQAAMLAGKEGERLWDYWREYLGACPPSSTLRFAQESASRGETRTHFFALPETLRFQLKQIAHSHRTTLHAVLLAVFEILLHRYGEDQEFHVGVLSDGRKRSQWAKVVGYFVNPILVRARVDPNATFSHHLARCWEELLQCVEHAEFPFSVLLERLHVRRTNGQVPLVRVMCMLQPALQTHRGDITPLALGRGGTSIRFGDLRLDSLDTDFQDAQFDLVFVAAELEEGLLAGFQYDAARFETATIEGLAAAFQTLLHSVIASQDQKLCTYQILDIGRTEAVLYRWNAAECVSVRECCIHEAIQQQAVQTPENTAVVFGAVELSYADLNAEANQLGRYLQDLGLGIESRVGVLMERSHEVLVAILGILKIGAAYVPMDPSSPSKRLDYILANSRVDAVMVSDGVRSRLPENLKARIVHWNKAEEVLATSRADIASGVTPDNLAYIMYTSGSTGHPKGVMVSHRNVMNFFAGMNKSVGCRPDDVFLALTSIAFDISILELLWTLTCGCKVVLAAEQADAPNLHTRSCLFPPKQLRASLFYFASADCDASRDPYRLLIEGAKLADRLGFDAVWTPERHFHPFGGLYPNPSLTSAALATITERIHLRAGSVVLPLQNPIRVAEEWALVDNLSNGRAGIAFASGWHANDFVFAPELFPDRREVMFQSIEEVKRLWRGEPIRAKGGAGNEVEVRTYPPPVQRELPVWLTAAGSPQTFISAGAMGANVLTHLLGQEMSALAERIALYRQAVQDSGHDPTRGTVTLMLHSYLAASMEKVREKAFMPFQEYLRSSAGLIETLLHSPNMEIKLEEMTEKDKEDLIAFAAERYFGDSGLLGTEAVCLERLSALRAIGVNEIACLIDFGIDLESVLESIERIHGMVTRLNRGCVVGNGGSPDRAASGHRVTMMQATPSRLRMMLSEDSMKNSLASMHSVLLGGEAVPHALVKEVAQTGVTHIFNMYGPTESTIWSTAVELDPSASDVVIGGPIANTQVYVLDRELMPLPPGVVGEIWIGGAGLARGYVDDPALTAERFVPDPFGRVAGNRLYRTGDMGRQRNDGKIVLHGRTDQQVKIRGHRVELGEIEAAFSGACGVKACVALKVEENDDERIVAIVVPEDGGSIHLGEIRAYLGLRLPPYMLPSVFHVVPSLPLTTTGKIDRRALQSMDLPKVAPQCLGPAPATATETKIAAIWKEVLRIESVSVDDNFFDVGGHSLLMVQVHHKLQRLLQRDFPLTAMLGYPTIRSLALHLQDGQEAEPTSDQERGSRQRKAFRLQRERALAARPREQGS